MHQISQRLLGPTTGYSIVFLTQFASNDFQHSIFLLSKKGTVLKATKPPLCQKRFHPQDHPILVKIKKTSIPPQCPTTIRRWLALHFYPNLAFLLSIEILNTVVKIIKIANEGGSHVGGAGRKLIKKKEETFLFPKRAKLAYATCSPRKIATRQKT